MCFSLEMCKQGLNDASMFKLEGNVKKKKNNKKPQQHFAV